jgi:hypothetical protein
VTNSTGSGGAVSGGVAFDTGTLTLQLAVGYGSAAGFSDLTGPATDMHIHGPAGPGTNGDPLVELSPYNFVAANDAARGGVIFGNIAFPTNSVSNLLAGLTYINIHTALNPDAEIRGQLIPQAAPVSNSPPVVVCPPDSRVECGTMTPVTAQVLDPEGDALTVVWTLNGSAVQTNTLPAQNPPVMTSVTFMGELPRGTNSIAISVTDSATNTTSCTTTVTVVDTTPPVLASCSATPNVLWPPNHKMVDVIVHARATDSCSSTTWRIVRVTSNEPVDGAGDGHTTPDWIITGPHTLKLRAERAGNGHGRVYSICIQASDAAGNHSTNRVVTVSVPHNR